MGCSALVSAVPLQASLEKTPSVLYLTWMHDPTTTMTVQWHTGKEDPFSEVMYRKEGQGQWAYKSGIYAQIPDTNFSVHTVELDALEPDTEYLFCLKGKEGEFRFRTLPTSLSRPMKFVIGGDAYRYLSTFRKMNAQIASQDPDFVVVGGDIAYTNGCTIGFLQGKGWQMQRWRTFLKEWKSQMTTADGRMIPMMVVLGNHDIRGSALKPKSVDILFYELFALQEKGVSYRAFNVGDYLSLFLLDTGHSYQIEGQQTQWLEKALSRRENASYKMAVYHIAAYPSVYPYEGETPTTIRSAWSPLFERYHLQVAFEHHNHAYKRTYPLKAEKIDPDGVIYMGDGSWGVTPRNPKKLWYLHKTAKTNAVCLVTLHSDRSTVDALNIKGEVIDSVTLYPTGAMVSWNGECLMQQ